MFVVPPEAFKSKRPHVVVLNDVAWSIIETQRGKHPIWVFPYRGRRIGTMNNNGWQEARREAGLPLVRVHDLRHRSRAVCEQEVFLPKIVKCFLAMRIVRWPVITRVPTSVAC